MIRVNLDNFEKDPRRYIEAAGRVLIPEPWAVSEVLPFCDRLERVCRGFSIAVDYSQKLEGWIATHHEPR